MPSDRFDDGFEDDEDDRPRRRRSRDDEPDYEEPHRGGLLLALGLVGLLACPVVSPFAWVMGANDLRAMDERRMDPEGRSNTQAGKILGIVGTILLALQVMALLVYVVVIAVVIAAKG